MKYAPQESHKIDDQEVMGSRLKRGISFEKFQQKYIYTSGVRAMKELDDTLQKKSSSNLEQIKSTIYAQTMAVEIFLITAVSESEEIIRDIKNSLDEQKQLATLSAQQQEEGLKRSLVSKQAVSEATTDFFNDLCYHSSKFLTTIEQNFTEQSAREEKLAVEKIAAILRTLTSNKAYMVESQFVEDTFLAAETKAAIESNLRNGFYLPFSRKTAGYSFEGINVLANKLLSKNVFLYRQALMQNLILELVIC
ncbi:hypothetical protein GIB67_037532 [Kingdonia uniflora]|uniref:Uncharacterized protein n=1 Tax=Kingdonia uniflora TaxID=39325 RepID=A0A7J7NB51_9MAGN|nr:hypothetical protein GIB67_037532 [Kingdonia uniflora]